MEEWNNTTDKTTGGHLRGCTREERNLRGASVYRMAIVPFQLNILTIRKMEYAKSSAERDVNRIGTLSYRIEYSDAAELSGFSPLVALCNQPTNHGAFDLSLHFPRPFSLLVL